MGVLTGSEIKHYNILKANEKRKNGPIPAGTADRWLDDIVRQKAIKYQKGVMQYGIGYLKEID